MRPCRLPFVEYLECHKVVGERPAQFLARTNVIAEVSEEAIRLAGAEEERKLIRSSGTVQSFRIAQLQRRVRVEGHADRDSVGLITRQCHLAS